MLLVGVTSCAKTTYLLKMLENDYINHFEHVVLICPTFEFNKTYQEWKYLNDINFIAIQCNHDQVDTILKHVSIVCKGTNSLIILDDCAASQSVNNRVSQLVLLAFSAGTTIFQKLWLLNN